MRLVVLLLISLMSPIVGADEWSAPENPNPSLILQGIRVDLAQGDYKVALAKHIWYHDHALTLQPAQAGVRLSFALSGWLKLGEVYPPALQKLKEIRDALEVKIRDKDRVRVRFEDFQEFAALNRTLRQEARTAETFKWLYETDPEDAQRVFDVSKPALIKQKEFALFALLLHPAKDVAHIGNSYSQNLELSGRFDNSFLEYAENKFVNDSATLVAILILNDRKEEATTAAKALKAFAKNEDIQNRLDKELAAAMTGTVPMPY